MRDNKRGKKHATVTAADGVNYRDMAAVMTKLGFPMFHSSARNNILRVMYHFASKLGDYFDLDLTEEQLWERARSPEFQEVIGELLRYNHDVRSMRAGK